MAGLYGCERIVGYGNVVECSCAEECALSSIGLSDYPDLHKDHETLGGSDSSYPDPGALCAVTNVQGN